MHLASLGAAFYVINSFLRPFRMALAVSISPLFEKIILLLQERLHCSRKVAVTAVVFLFNIVGTTSAMVFGVNLASFMSGIPIRP